MFQFLVCLQFLIEELAFFDIQSLPELSSKRTTKEQLEILWEIYQGDREQYLD